MSKELDIEQLRSDVASLLRIQDVMRNEVQRVQDELSCITHKAKHLELQVTSYPYIYSLSQYFTFCLVEGGFGKYLMYY